MEKMTQLLFSYGTLQKKEVQLEIFGRFLIGTKDILKGYQLAFLEIKDESFLSKGNQETQKTLIPSSDNADIIEGTDFEISEEELLLADKYEPVNYKRARVDLQSGREAWIYRAA